MKNELGSRSRFLFRVIVYSIAPVVGLVVFLLEWGNLQGMLIGGMGISVGLLSQYMIFSRLVEPLSAIRFAVHARRNTLQVARSVLDQIENDSTAAFVTQFNHAMTGEYPDVLIGELAILSSRSNVLAVCDDIFLIVCESQDEISQMEASNMMQALEVPLKKHYYNLIWLREREITTL